MTLFKNIGRQNTATQRFQTNDTAYRVPVYFVHCLYKKQIQLRGFGRKKQRAERDKNRPANNRTRQDAAIQRVIEPLGCDKEARRDG